MEYGPRTTPRNPAMRQDDDTRIDELAETLCDTDNRTQETADALIALARRYPAEFAALVDAEVVETATL